MKLNLLLSFALFIFIQTYSVVSKSETEPALVAGSLDVSETKPILSLVDVFNEILNKIKETESQVNEKFKTLYKLSSEERALVAVQILDLEQQLSDKVDSAVSLILDMKDDNLDTAKQVILIQIHLNRRNKQLVKSYKYIQKLIRKEQSGFSKLKIDELFSYEQKINKSRKILENFLLYYQGNVEHKRLLGLDFTQDIAVYSELLLSASQELSSRLKLVTEQIKSKKIAIGQTVDEGASDFKTELNSLNEKKNGIISSLSVVITLMNKYELNTAKYSQLLITSSGTINEQIFDKEVVSGLLVQWGGELEKWVKLNLSNFIVKTLIVILILVIFRLLSLLAARLLSKGFERSAIKVSKLLREFFVSTFRRIVMLIGVLIALSQTGVELGALLAGLGVIGFIVGFALQGVLSNFASGLMILIYRPYDVGDVVEIAGATGTVKEMSMVSTTMLSFSNEKLIIPNNNIWGSLIKNITSEKERRIDLVFKISFDADLDRVEAIFNEEVKAHSAILSEPAVAIKLHKQLETHLEYIVRPWVKTEDYWSTYWDLNRSINKRLDDEGVPRLFPYAFLKTAEPVKT